MQTKPSNWDPPEQGSKQLEPISFSRKKFVKFDPDTAVGQKKIWMSPELTRRAETANLDSQDPPTLYYLGRLVDIPQINQIYVEKRDDGGLKHWAVLEERDYEVMEHIYEIEEDTLDRFPMADLNFRVTIFTEGGPSISNTANKIYDSR